MADPIIKNDSWWKTCEKLRNIGYKLGLRTTKSMYIHIVVNKLVYSNTISKAIDLRQLALAATKLSELELAVTAACYSDKVKDTISSYVNEYFSIISGKPSDLADMTSHIASDYTKQLVAAARLFLGVTQPNELFGFLQEEHQQYLYRVKTDNESVGLIKQDEQLFNLLEEHVNNQNYDGVL